MPRMDSAPTQRPDDEARLARLIDSAALARWMDAQKLPGSGSPLEAKFIAGGASNEVVEIRRGGERFVLRRPPHNVPKGRNQTMLREYRVLSALRDTDVPHARVHAGCDDESVIGSFFYLMDFVDGWTPMSRMDAPFDTNLEARREMGFELVGAIAKLANVDWRAAGLEGLGKPEGFLDRQVDRWLAHLSGFKFREIPGLDEAASWLREHTPREFRSGILHGDYQFANVMFAHGAPARLAAIVDWEMSTVGDPLLDLGWVLMSWPDPEERTKNDSEMTYFDYTGMPTRAELTQYYAERSHLPVDALDYYIVLARFKMACVLEGGYARYVAGGADNPKMESFGAVVLEMATKAAALAESSRL